MPDLLHLNGATATMGFDRYGHMIAPSSTRISMKRPGARPDVARGPRAATRSAAGTTSQLGNAYWYLDNNGRVVIGKGTHEIVTLREGGTADAPTLELVRGRSV